AERVLADAGVASPRADAELLAAHVVGVDRGKLMMHPLVDPPVLEALRELVERRAKREPLQHLLGTAVLGPVEVAVGPGVFTPRPETEDRKSTRLNSSHVKNSYAVFCLKKKTNPDSPSL